MSLLMQALKKAENAKQKQAEQNDAPALTTEASAVSTSESLPLTLQPQEPSADEQAQADASAAAAQETHSSTTSSLDYFSTVQAEPPSPARASTLAEQQAALEADSGLAPRATTSFPLSSPDIPPDSTPEKQQNIDPTLQQNTAQQMPPEKDIPRGGGTHGKLKIGLDEKQSAAIEAKKKLATRHAAQSVFAAKQTVPRRRAIVIAMLGLIILCAVGAYGYVNLIGLNQSPYANIAAAPQPNTAAVIEEVRSLGTTTQTDETLPNPGDLNSNNPNPALTSTEVATEARAIPESTGAISTDSGQKLTAASPVSSTTPAPDPTFAPVLASPTAMSTANAMPAPAMPTSTQASAPTVATNNGLAAFPSAQPPLSTMTKQSDAIQVRHTAATKQLNPHLSSAYQSYVAGDLMTASTQYKTVLRQEPNNRDALLGVATIAIRRGQNAEAGSFYSRLLELNPNDTDASAGLASLDYNDPSKAESRLKNSLAKSPDSSATLFALGNVYAEQSRWSEAQQSYFRAFGIAPENADYAYNLAISLDQLEQPKLALEYYQRALQLAQKNGGNLDRNIVTNRIHALQSVP
tara:strand:+ start:143724 stop:145457 length:1734 start_codon:yes stop_codon:yes gene_type:complete